MTNLNAIELDGVTKAYRSYTRPLDRLRELVTRHQLGVDRVSVSDVTFNVAKGEVVGIIGRNGAGKSTLLKMIAGRLEPSSGRLRVQGNVAAILELGTGFHPDLSGRENVVVGGLCLGLSKSKIESEMQSIIDFSELGDVIDMPFRTYSSGMQARLTFATAVTVDPDILIIDEALSVGDNKFQLKSFNRIRRFKEQGKTILLVTHGMSAVTTFCDRAILLDKGRVIADGEPNWVTSVYHHLQFGKLDVSMLKVPQRTRSGTVDRSAANPGSAAQANHTVALAVGPQIEHEGLTSDHAINFGRPVIRATPQILEPFKGQAAETEVEDPQGYRYGDGRARLVGVALVDREGTKQIREATVGDICQMVLDCQCLQDGATLYAGFLIRDPKGEIVFGSDTTLGTPEGGGLLLEVMNGERRRIVAQVAMWLSPGEYFLSAALTTEPGKQSDMWFDAYEFRILGPATQHTNSRVFMDPAFSVHAIETTAYASAQEPT